MKKTITAALLLSSMWILGIVFDRYSGLNKHETVEPHDGLCWAFAMTAQMAHERSNKGRISYPLSIGYLAVAQIADTSGLLESRLPMPLSVAAYGVMPEAAFPTTAELLASIGGMSREDARRLLSAELINDAKSFSRKYIEIDDSDKWVNLLDRRLLKKKAEVFLGARECRDVRGLDVCYRDVIFPYALEGGVSVVLENGSDDGDAAKYHMVFLAGRSKKNDIDGFNIVDMGNESWMPLHEVEQKIRGVLLKASRLKQRDVTWSRWSEDANLSDNNLVYYSQANCDYCRKFESDLLRERDINTIVNSIPHYKLMRDEHAEAVKKNKIRYFPSFLLLDGSGAVLNRLEGYMGKDAFLAFMNSVRRFGDTVKDND